MKISLLFLFIKNTCIRKKSNVYCAYFREGRLCGDVRIISLRIDVRDYRDNNVNNKKRKI